MCISTEKGAYMRAKRALLKYVHTLQLHPKVKTQSSFCKAMRVSVVNKMDVPYVFWVVSRTNDHGGK